MESITSSAPPRESGIQGPKRDSCMWHWIPACAGMSGLIAKKPAAPSLGLTPREFAMEDRACASAGADLHAERRRHVRLLAGGAVATGDGGALDAVFLERIADRDRAGRAVDLRTARRQQVGGVDDVLLGDVD